MQAVKVTRKQIAAIIAATFPEYAGRMFKAEAVEAVTLFDLNWSGSTRNEYRAATIAGTAAGNAARWNRAAPWANPAEGARVPVPAGVVIVEHSIFCGKDCGLRLYVNPADMPRVLPAP